jgi:thioredoxin-like negative regulator of GroEL
VKAFRDGAVVSEFVGALPPAAVAGFLGGLTTPAGGAA